MTQFGKRQPATPAAAPVVAAPVVAPVAAPAKPERTHAENVARGNRILWNAAKVLVISTLAFVTVGALYVNIFESEEHKARARAQHCAQVLIEYQSHKPSDIREFLTKRAEVVKACGQ